MIEKNYKAAIESSKIIKIKVKENSEKVENIIKNSLNRISQKYHDDIINILGAIKISFQEPFSILNNYINQICQVDIKNELEELYKNFGNKNITSANIFPSKYKLKTIELINNNNKNDNIFSLSLLDDEDDLELEKLNKEKEEISEVNLLVIKHMYNNFTLLSANKIDIKSEEEKLQTKKLSNKLFLNIKNFNNNRKINTPSEKIFTQKDFEDLEKLIDKIYNRYIFLQRLTRFRALKYEFSPKYFIMIGKLLNAILLRVNRDNDYFGAKNCIILSQTFFCNYKNEKVYLKAYIQNNQIFKSQKFWDNLIDNIIDYTQINQKENIFGNLYTLISNMFDFGLKESEVKEIIEPKIKKYDLDNNHLKDIDDLIKMKLENGNQDKENKINDKYISEIKEKYLKEIQDETEEKGNNIFDIINSNFDNKEDKINKYNKNYTFNKSNNKKISAEINKNKKQSIWDLDES